VSRAITALAMRFAAMRALRGTTDGCTLELMFVLPDVEEGPTFDGMRLSTYDAGEKVLVVEAAIPARILDSERAASYVAAVAADAVDAASDFFAEQRVAFDADHRHAALRMISVSDLERQLHSRNLPESAWVDAAGDAGTRT